MTQDIIIGTEKTLILKIDPIDNISPGEIPLTVEYFCNASNVVTISGDSLTWDEDNGYYLLPIDSTKVGVGRLKIRVIAKIPDLIFQDGERTEIKEFITNLNIINGMK